MQEHFETGGGAIVNMLDFYKMMGFGEWDKPRWSTTNTSGIVMANRMGDDSSHTITEKFNTVMTGEDKGGAGDEEEDAEDDETENGKKITEGEEGSLSVGDMETGIDTSVPAGQCGDCKTVLDTSGYQIRDKKYWLCGLKCNKEGCAKVFNENNVTRNTALMVCTNTRLFKEEDE